MKKVINTKKLLFENMAKLNPGFKLNEGDIGYPTLNIVLDFANDTTSIRIDGEVVSQDFQPEKEALVTELLELFKSYFENEVDVDYSFADKDGNEQWGNWKMELPTTDNRPLFERGIRREVDELFAEINAHSGLTTDFNLNEDKKWIQKAVNPEHKGYCTPMTKPTCTPQRKALAKRFKKGIDEATDKGREIIYKFKTDAITETIGSRDGKQYTHPVHLIEGNPKYAPIYNGVVLSISDTPGSWYVDTLMEGNTKNSNIMYIDFGAKWICSNWSEIMKELNEWISNSGNFQKEGPINEKAAYENYRFETLSAALDAVRAKVAQKGYTVDEEAIWEQFGTGGIGYNQSKANIVIPLLKNGMPEKNRSITVSIYRTENGIYELISNMN